MQITLKLYAFLTDFLPADARRTNATVVDVADGSSLAELIAARALPPRLVHLVLLNGEFIPPGERAGRTLVAGDVVAIWPPIAGG